MFGLSLTKILLTIFVIVAVWYGWRWYQRYQALEAKRERDESVPKNDRRANGRGQVEAEDMIECRTCGAFVAASRRVGCGRKDCPFPG
jgi:uncharacterized protein